jgi:hypothetical protein
VGNNRVTAAHFALQTPNAELQSKNAGATPIELRANNQYYCVLLSKKKE